MSAGKIAESLEEGGIYVLTIVNPDRRNAFTPDMRVDLAARIEAAHADRAVRVIALRGEGGHFCAGADVTSGVGQGDATPIELLARIKEAQNLVRAIALGSKPVIAAVEGAAVGAGFAVAIACDIVVAAEDAKFIPNFTSLGITAEFGLFSTLPRRVGHQLARRIIYLSERFSGAQAVEIGMADELASPGGSQASAMEIARQFAALPPLALAATKRAFAARVESLEDSLNLELDIMPALGASADFKEAIAAFREKRAPKFTGC
jgi:2-(1,2-epoxy-1,2-dihydrophenyl)acetyl-CoA isomerase